MSYYRGDWYRGDYYRGDPGIFGFLGSAAKAVGKVALGVARATPIGQAIGVAGQAVQAVSRIGAHSPPPPANLPAIIPQIPTGLQGPATGTRAGKGQLEVGVSPLGTVGVHYAHKRRRMNVTNVRALRRALRRAHGFAHLARGVMSYQITGKRGHFTHFKTKRRSR